jgi:SAM-dependent MidA family methyltransferase
LDALPVCLVDVRGDDLQELWVASDGADLLESWGEPSTETATAVELLFGTLDPVRLRPHTSDSILEVVPGFEDLVREVAAAMPAGSFVNVDYGDWFFGVGPAQSGWSCGCDTRGLPLHRRTLRGYFRHQLVRDPFARPGRQDLTADVDFAALDYHGRRAGFETVAFTTLAAFLRGGGADRELQALRAVASPGAVDGETPASAEAAPDLLEADRQATVLRNLLDDEDLGAAFKIMVQVKE